LTLLATKILYFIFHVVPLYPWFISLTILGSIFIFVLGSYVKPTLRMRDRVTIQFVLLYVVLPQAAFFYAAWSLWSRLYAV